MNIAVLREIRAGERRVALTPEAVQRLVGLGHIVRVETGAGLGAGWPDALYADAGGEVCNNAAGAMAAADVVVRVNPPADNGDSHEIDDIPAGAALISMLNPLGDKPGVEKLANHGTTAFAMEMIPRTSRAQSMDVLSSMATVAGYRAVLIAAEQLDKFFPMLMTAAGTVAPAKVFVIGAGVAGLQAIATARRLGAVVTAYDTRAAVREQVESLGARFFEFSVTDDAEAEGGYARELTADEQAKQRELMGDHIATQDVVITTALVPGRPAPELIPVGVVDQMRSGSVIIDLAAENGGNCSVTEYGATVVHNGVKVIGPENLPADMPVHASQLYAKNVMNFLDLLSDEGAIVINRDDDIIAGTLICTDGAIVNEMLLGRYGLAAPTTGGVS